MPIQAVIFDFGGVLVRSESEAGRRKWEARLGLPQGEVARVVFDSEPAARATVGQLGDSDVWTHAADVLQLDTAQLDEFRHDFFSGDRLDAGLLDFLKGLRPRYRTAILSNAWPGARRAFVEMFGLGGAVDQMIISAEEGLAKPDVRIYQLAAARLDVPLEACVFVDDFLVNVEAARAAGMQAVHFSAPAQARAEVERLLQETA